MQNPSFFARKGVFAGETFAGSLRFSIKVAAGGRFAAQIESAPKRNTTRVGGVSFWSGLRGSNSLPGIPRIAFRNSQEPCLTSNRNALRAWVSVSSSFRLTKKIRASKSDVLIYSGAGYEARTRFPASHELRSAIRRNPASPLIEMRFAHGCRYRVLSV